MRTAFAVATLIAGITLMALGTKVAHSQKEGGQRQLIFGQIPVYEIQCGYENEGMHCWMSGNVLHIELSKRSTSIQQSGSNSAAVLGDGNRVTINGEEKP